VKKIGRIEQDRIVTLKVDDIIPNPNQPRKDFNEEKLKELGENIKAVGLKQPLIVRALKDGKYQIVDGERRYRACRLIKLEDIPVEIRHDIKTEQDAAIQSFIINNERSGYLPQDKDAYIFHLYETTKLSTRKLAEKLGKHHSFVDHCIEAHRFRQRLPPTLVGTLPLTHTALKQTAIIKDDKLRIRFLKMIADGKLKQDADTIKDVYQILEKIPADREEVFEAYFLGMLTSAQIKSLLEGAPIGREILIEQQGMISRLSVEKIRTDVKHRILNALPESEEKPFIEWSKKVYKEILDQQLRDEPDKKSKHVDIRHSHELQTFDSPDEIHRHFQYYSINAIKEKYSSDADIWRVIQCWFSVLYEYEEKIRHIESEELAIAVLDVVAEVLYWEALKRGFERDQEIHKHFDAGGEISVSGEPITTSPTTTTLLAEKEDEIERLKKELEELKNNKQ
jgi:ParB family transcriptional regulator, chromosome partitioning protein